MLLFNEYSVSIWNDEKVLKMDGGDGCKQCECSYCHRTVHFKIIKMIHFVMHFTTFKNIFKRTSIACYILCKIKEKNRRMCIYLHIFTEIITEMY